jgi:nucleoside-diphosphate-sugar epimerase
MTSETLTVCLTGATGWLGQSLIHANQDSLVQHHFDAFGRSESEILTNSGTTLKNNLFDLKKITSKQYDVFAPLAFATRDKALQMSEQDYIDINKRLVIDAVNIIRSGKVGSVLNISSGVVIQKSESQLLDSSYVIYADLKRFQEDLFSSACNSVGIPFINCRVFSLSGQDMKEPSKYAIGNLVQQAISTGSIQLSSKGLVIRRYMDSRNLMSLLLEYVRRGDSVSVESGGEKVDLFQLAKQILKLYGHAPDSISFGDTNKTQSNEYFSLENHFETIAGETNYALSGIDDQIANVAKSLERLQR